MTAGVNAANQLWRSNADELGIARWSGVWNWRKKIGSARCRSLSIHEEFIFTTELQAGLLT
jgi:hypothetical protein